ncbi:MAG: Ppx/GppA phosphatase family protein [Gemmatimonadota bacterium]
MRPHVDRKATRLAALDVGTNSIRLVVAQVESGVSYRILREEREMTRLGERLSETARLSDPAMERSVEAIGRMKAIADALEARELRAIATSAVREAENGRDFLRLAWERHRIRVQVITAEEEARLALRSVARHFDVEDRPVAIADIGGGSMEVVFCRGAEIERVHSLPLGAVCLTERYLRGEPMREKEWTSLRGAIDRAIERAIGTPPFDTPLMIGSGGTFTALAAMAMFQREGRTGPVQGYAMTRSEVVQLLDRLREMPLEQRRRIEGLSPDRADIIVAGAAAVSRLAERLGCRRILVNDGGIRDGLLLSMIAEVPEGDEISSRA